MSILDILYKPKTISAIGDTDVISPDNCVEPEAEIEKTKVEEWIWVEGYKGTNAKMQGWGNFQFELGKTYTAEGEISLCSNGFHFNLKLSDTVSYYNPFKEARFFKVRALVRKSDFVEYGDFVMKFGSFGRVDKLVAKEISFIEEIDSDTLHAATGHLYYSWDKEQFSDFRKSGLSYEDFLITWFINQLKGMYSEHFSRFLAREIAIRSHDAIEMNDKLNKLTTKAIGLYEDNVSPDMRAYLLLKGI